MNPRFDAHWWDSQLDVEIRKRFVGYLDKLMPLQIQKLKQAMVKTLT